VKRRFRITVEGKSWDVEVEELGSGADGPAAIGPFPGPGPVPGACQPIGRPEADGEVRAPAPGKILRVAVKVGDRVEARGLLLVIETMKIESRIEAPRAGTVAAVHISPGDTVQTGNPLVSLS